MDEWASGDGLVGMQSMTAFTRLPPSNQPHAVFWGEVPLHHLDPSSGPLGERRGEGGWWFSKLFWPPEAGPPSRWALKPDWWERKPVRKRRSPLYDVFPARIAMEVKGGYRF